MRKISIKLVVAAVMTAMVFASCARQPATKRSAALIKSHFKKYAKKYPDTIYGKTPVANVEISEQNEIHKNLVAVESFITLSDGKVERIYATIERGPFYWRFVSWENDTGL